jgi:alkanesulfonate monooxygenase SsuD/methylene tetrahydromethanopterin reductase-like flavin-dependent oxidoreductase (luciferase family)
MTDRLLRVSKASYDGEFYRANEARSVPGCIQQPRAPFAIAATGPRGMQLAARFADIWVTTGDRSGPGGINSTDGAGIIARQVAQLTTACERAGRDPATIDRMVVTGPLLSPCMESVESFRSAIACYAAVGVTDLVVHWPRDEDPYAADLERFQEVFASRDAEHSSQRAE